MRVHVLELPRIASTSTSSTASSAAAFGWRFFHRSRPSSASALCSALAMVISGSFDTRRPVGLFFRFDGATRGGSPSCFL
jgi:hypothetical protein